MVCHKFDNNYDMILSAFGALLDHFQSGDMLFTVQCIWWIASIIKFTEILTYYRQYKIFPSEYLQNWIVSPLARNKDGRSVSDCDIPEIRLDRHIESSGIHPELVLATGPGNPPAVRVWTAKTGRFSSRPGQKPDPLTLGGPNPDPYPSTRVFRRVWLDPSVPISCSAFRVSHIWSHSDMLLLIVK